MSGKADERCVLGLAKRRALGQVRFGFGNSGASRPIPQPARAQPLSDHEDRTPTHGYEPTREAAMAAFAKSWRRQ